MRDSFSFCPSKNSFFDSFLVPDGQPSRDDVSKILEKTHTKFVNLYGFFIQIDFSRILSLIVTRM